MKWFQIPRASKKQSSAQDSEELQREGSGATTWQNAEDQNALAKPSAEQPLLTV